MWRLVPQEARFFDLFDQQSQHIARAAAALHELVHTFSDARAKAAAIKEIEHQADQVTHEIVRRLNTTFITPIDREDIYTLASRLDDVVDYIEASADRLVIYRVKEPTSACRAMADVILQIVQPMNEALRALRAHDRASFHTQAVEVNRLENRADDLLRESLKDLFDEEPDPIQVIKWKEIYETMEIVTDRCEDVVNAIEAIVLKMS